MSDLRHSVRDLTREESIAREIGAVLDGTTVYGDGANYREKMERLIVRALKAERIVAQADARRAALEQMIVLLNAEAKDVWDRGDSTEAKECANEALSLVGCKVRALLDDAELLQKTQQVKP